MEGNTIIYLCATTFPTKQIGEEGMGKDREVTRSENNYYLFTPAGDSRHLSEEETLSLALSRVLSPTTERPAEEGKIWRDIRGKVLSERQTSP